jgi:Ca2+-binding RTX toxin-like protein
LFSAARDNASLTNGRSAPPISLSRAGTDPISPSQPAHSGVSAKVANRATSQPAIGEYRRAMEALSPSPVASGRRVHEELSRLHPQDDDDLAELLPDPFSFPRTKLRASEVDIMEVVARCPRKSSLHVDGWKF